MRVFLPNDPPAARPAEPDPDCTCSNLDARGQNPTCPAHPWHRHDPIVLQLADHPDGPWAAALKVFGGSE